MHGLALVLLGVDLVSGQHISSLLQQNSLWHPCGGSARHHKGSRALQGNSSMHL